MAKRKSDGVRIIRIKKGESLKSIYAKVRRQFTAADLAKFGCWPEVWDEAFTSGFVVSPPLSVARSAASASADWKASCSACRASARAFSR